MTSPLPENAKNVIRPFQYRDLEAIEQLTNSVAVSDSNSCSVGFKKQLPQVRRWYGLLKLLSWFPNPWQYAFGVYVAQQLQQIQGLIKISPFNNTRSTWQVEQVIVDADTCGHGKLLTTAEIGSRLLRHCFETIWEARTWVLEVNIHDTMRMALYRQNGFCRLAQMTYWQLEPSTLQKLASRQPNLPNLLPVSNADAQLLYQLDKDSMPPPVFQVFARQIQDFKTGLLSGLLEQVQQWLNKTEVVSGYVFEPQRKAAIGYFKLKLYREGDQAHQAQMTVHPAYTCLYPELISQMARVAQEFPDRPIQLTSADYQSEGEDYLEQLGAKRLEHNLLMYRSVWHKVRESKPVSFELSEVLKGLQPVRTPIPSRIVLSPSPSTAMKPHTPQADRSTISNSSLNKFSQKPNSLPTDTKLPLESPESPKCRKKYQH
ncbi:MAG: GNAT family N-acetyltransferase [Symploca sp. SIO3C6]|nr:GNAT family N-acetyltransferase [Symploca sp. SIO3C6]NET04390.1 GNAT family N-acetyltransferase [Symploca sp. SIO2B6]